MSVPVVVVFHVTRGLAGGRSVRTRAVGSGRDGGEAGVPGDEQARPGRGGLDVQQESSSSPGEGGADGEQAQPEPFGGSSDSSMGGVWSVGPES
jgi:hypothetical protein